MIEILRKNGNFQFYSKNKCIIPVRNLKHGRVENPYVVCKNCRGFYKKRTASVHISKCSKDYTKHDRTLMVQGRRFLLEDHPLASKILKYHILPKLRSDNIASVILNDRVIICYGNKLAKKYSNVRNFKMIRSNLRLLGRLFF